MVKAKSKLILAAVLSASFILTPVLTSTAKAANDTESQEYQDRFLNLRDKINDPSNGYFREITTSDGKTLKVPYHSVETLIVEAPDYGHETTSEGYSYYMWLEAMYGKFTNDWSAFSDAWTSADTYIIPQGENQKGMNTYKPNDPADLVNEYESISKYPSKVDSSAKVGQDTISNDLKTAYGSDEMYGMHWLLDTDNWYGYGNRGDASNTDPSYINTFQRGGNESVWKAITHPSYEKFNWGSSSGFLPLFTLDNNYSKQWRYTVASDADARAVQATYWADQWAKEDNSNSNTNVTDEISKASKMGDYLRYSMFDKYFRNIGEDSNGQDQGTNKHYLLGWYYGWGGSDNGDWSWKIGSSHTHFGYQNPMTAWIMSNTTDFKPKSQSGQSDWAKSLDRQIEFYQWLQSSEGAIAGGATNSYTTDAGSYQSYPAGTPTFYGMAYQEAPVYNDPPSNQWSGMQGWSMQRLAEYFYQTGDKRAGTVLDKWVKWLKPEIHIKDDGTFEVPGDLGWSGQPDTWTGTSTGNPNLHVTVKNYSQDLGEAASLANTLMYYSAATNKYTDLYPNGYDKDARDLSKNLLDSMWNKYQDDKGLSSTEARADYSKFFDQEVYVPSGFSGKMANGDAIKSGIKFIDIRSKYKQDPQYAKLLEAYNNGEAPEFNYHRFWAQSEIAIANGTYSLLVKDLPSDVLKGDVNGDGEITLADVLALKKYITNPNYEINKANSDINGDGTINIMDLVELRDLI